MKYFLIASILFSGFCLSETYELNCHIVEDKHNEKLPPSRCYESCEFKLWIDKKNNTFQKNLMEPIPIVRSEKLFLIAVDEKLSPLPGVDRYVFSTKGNSLKTQSYAYCFDKEFLELIKSGALLDDETKCKPAEDYSFESICNIQSREGNKIK